MMKGKIVVCGTTGNQGSAVIAALLAAKPANEIVALTRSAQSPKAQKLKEKTVTVMEADLLDQSSLANAFAGAAAVFGVTQPWNETYTKCDTVAEMKQGRNIIAAAKECGIQHLVFSSVLSFNNQPIGVKHADSKLVLEEEVKASGLNCTILRCSQFMDNIGSKFFPVKEGKIKGFIAKDALVPYVACKDIGATAAHILLHPQLYQATTLDLIGDVVSGEDLAARFEQLRGRSFRYRSVPSLVLRLFAPEFYTMRRTFETYGRAPYSNQLTESFEYSRSQMKEVTSMKSFLKERFPNF